MNTGPIRYAVVCKHPEEQRRYFIADIDDYRPGGGEIRWELYRGGYGALVAPANKRGSRITIPLTCGSEACHLNVELQDTSLPELLDRIGPHRDALYPTEDFPLYEDVSASELEDVMFNGAEPGAGVVVGYQSKYVVQFHGLCEAVRMLRTRGKK